MLHRHIAIAVAVAAGVTAIGCASEPQQPGAATTQPESAAMTPARAVPPSAPPPAAPAPVMPPPPAPTPPAPAAAPAAPAAPTTGRTYIIKPGDSLWKISREVYGDGTKYEQIQKANPNIDPQLLKPGTTIVIP